MRAQAPRRKTGGANRERRPAARSALAAKAGGNDDRERRSASPAAGGKHGGSDDAMQAALAMLARRSQTSARIRERIMDRFGTEAAERTVARLLELRLLDDAAFAERFVRDRFERAGYGRERIRAELLARGVAAAQIQTAIASAIDADGERARAAEALRRFHRVRERRVGCTAPDAARKLRDAAFRHLIGRGFPSEIVRRLLADDAFNEE